MSIWHILDVGCISMKEFASALSALEQVVAWSPRMEKLGMFQDWQRPETLSNPQLRVLEFPLQRGYSRVPLRWVAPFERNVLKRMMSHTPEPEQSPLICSTPFYAPVAELWPGPVVYYVTDLNVAYEGLNPAQVKALDKRMCRVARAVCPNSARIAEYLVREAKCDSRKITLVPNATRESNLTESPLYEPGPLPVDVKDLHRPIVGVLGDLSGNLDWELIMESMKRTPFLSWLFIGPTNRVIADPQQNAAREWAKQNARFVGMKPYGELQKYARCLDAAVLPYRRREPTYSGSSTRFYEHLAAGRPMIATRGVAELLDKEPLLRLVDTAGQMVEALDELRSKGFQDGQEALRWKASRTGTWEARAQLMRSLIKPAKSGPLGVGPELSAAGRELSKQLTSQAASVTK